PPSATMYTPSLHDALPISDLRARPIFHRTRDAIEAHLTVVFTALAISRFMQDTTGASLKKIITSLRPLREFTGRDDVMIFFSDADRKSTRLNSSHVSISYA